MSHISSSAVEGALLVRMRRTERELREIEGEAQRWKEALARGTRNEQASSLAHATQEQNLLDELPGLCAEALQAAMQLRRRAETVRRSMSHIRNAAAEQSAARQGISADASGLPGGAGGGSTGSGGGGGGTPTTVRSPSGAGSSGVVSTPSRAFGSPMGRSTSGAPTPAGSGAGANDAAAFRSGGNSALAYFVEDFVKSEFSMQEQAWWDVMTDIERVEALSVQLLSVPSEEMSSARVRSAASMHQTQPADWMLENWDAAVTTSVGAALPGGLGSSAGSGLGRTGTTLHGVSPAITRQSPLAPSSLFSTFQSTPIPDLLLRRLQEQNRAKGIYGNNQNQNNSYNRGGGNQNNSNQYLDAEDGDGTGGSAGSGGNANNQNSSNQHNNRSYMGPIFASLAANPDIIAATDIDRLPKSDPLALFMSQMETQLEEERRNRGSQADSRFRGQDLPGGFSGERLDASGAAIGNGPEDESSSSSPQRSLTAAAPVPEPAYAVVRPEDRPSPEQRQRDWEELQRREAQEKEDKERRLREEKEAADKAREQKEREEKEAAAAAEAAELEKQREQERKKQEAAAAAAQAEKELQEAEDREKQKAADKAKKEADEAAAAAAAAEKKKQQKKEEKKQQKDDDKEKDDDKKQQEAAAVKIQARQRGRSVRKDLEKLKAEGVVPQKQQQQQEEPSKKEQEKQQQQQPEKKQEESAAAADDKDQKELEQAALKIQTAERARNARKELGRLRAQSVANAGKKEEKGEAGDSSAAAAATPTASDDGAAASSKKKQDDGDDGNKKKDESADDDAAGGGEEEEDPVKKALAAGEWKEVKDPKGRVYYANKATKETTWDLAKWLKKNAGAGGGECKHKKK